MAYKDLRDWLKQAEELGEVVRLEGIHWELEASAAATMTNKVIVFDKVPGYPPGHRLVTNLAKTTLKRFFLTSGWSTEARGLALTKAWMERMREFKPCPPKTVEGGPVMENIQTGKDVDLFKFPVPRGHEKEGGRYIGSADCVIVRDPDTGRVNLGTYRMQVHDRSTVGINFQESKDARIIMDKYHQQGKPCPVVALVGVDPALFKTATSHLVNVGGLEDLDFVGWLKGQPEEVFAGKYTGLPIPAHAEIALEGEIPVGKTRPEGPFTEWCGMSLKKDLPFIEVKTVYHRDNPILTVTLGREVKPPGPEGLRMEFHSSAIIWDEMEKAGVRGIRGVARYGTRLTVVSLHNLYAGHSRQAGLVASQVHAGANSTSYVIVVDADIDPTDIQAVVWAMVNRVEPKRAIQMLEYCCTDHLGIMSPEAEQKQEPPLRKGGFYVSRAIIDTCRPVEWDPAWHQDVVISQELKEKVRQKCGALLSDEGSAAKLPRKR
ncbi:MAG: UbiD family decarboxylase [Dehalococcoidia bacterium]|nr:UbiD family decarboxylase [Dehalococcoidia bacterium]